MKEKSKLGDYRPLELESSVREFWERIGLPELLRKVRAGRKKFYLLDGPPYVNAVPHVGHIKTTVCKDIWSKIKGMQGFDPWLQPGFDCHGLPVEVMVEKELGITSKQEIENLGVERFINHCLSKVLHNEKVWVECYRLLGAWRGFYEPYFTYRNYYIESAWWTLKKLRENGLLVRGRKPIHWCPKCETALAGYEVSDSYRNLTDPSLFLKVRVKGRDEFLVVWTTTPWTLPGNTALAVHPDETYVKVRAGGETLILAEKRAGEVMEKAGLEYEVVEKFPGSRLVGLEYEPILDVEVQRNVKRTVVASVPIQKSRSYGKHGSGEDVYEDFVSVEEGSGIVHVAPGHGDSDYLLGKHYDLDVLSPVDERGRFTDGVGEFTGIPVREANERIIEHLKARGLVLHSGKITHSYPVCWRCKTPLIFRVSEQWYLKVEPIKGRMLESASRVRWMPEYAGKRFEKWVAEREDWCISQQRYWGIPMPIWVCECGSEVIVESAEELEKLAGRPLELNDLHRHVVDRIEIPCRCGGKMKRVPDIFNVWFDSGIAPWASLGYPKSGKEFEEMFPCDLVVEAQDQIRGWFDSLMFLSQGVFGSAPYRAVGLVGWVVDEKGEKMSKSVGNVIWAEDILGKISSDAVRLYYCWENAPWEIQKFSVKRCEEMSRYLNILWNVCSLFLEHRTEGDAEKKTEDRWLLSRLAGLIEEVNRAAENFEFHVYGRLLVDFTVNDLSRWYVKLVRDRIKKGDPAAISTLEKVLDALLRLFAPITPFVTEHLYQVLFGRKPSIHIEDWPEPGPRDRELEEKVGIVRKVVEVCNRKRKELGVKLRYPLKSATIYCSDTVRKALEDLGDMFRKAANLMAFELRDIGEPEEAKPVFSSLGKKFGKDTQRVAEAIRRCDPSELRRELEKGKAEVEGFEIGPEDVRFLGREDFPGCRVVLNTEADGELRREWLRRELVRAIQAARKELGLSPGERAAALLPEELLDLDISETSCEPRPGTGEFSFTFEGREYRFGVAKA